MKFLFFWLLVNAGFFYEHNHLVAVMCTLFVAGRMFLPGTPESCTNKTYQDDITALNTHHPIIPTQPFFVI